MPLHCFHLSPSSSLCIQNKLHKVCYGRSQTTHKSAHHIREREHKRCAPASGGEFAAAAAAKRGIFEYQKTIHDKHSIKKNIDKLSPKAV